MRVFFVLILSLCLGLTANKAQSTSPKEITKAFIQDYKVWSIAADKMFWSDGEDRSRETYLELIAKYCVPNKEIGSIVISEIPEHSLEFETILTSEITETKAIVYTKFYHDTITHMRHLYEYHYQKIKGKWRLEELYAVEKGTKYPQL